MVLEQITGAFAGTAAKVGGYSYYAAAIVICMVVFGGIIVYLVNKRSYNVHVVIIRPRSGTSAFDWEAGYWGKYFLNKNREMRFKIWNAKKLKIQYNEEPIDQEFIIKRMIKGRYHSMVAFIPNTEGWLQPTRIDIDNLGALKATVSNADLTYYQSELALMDQYFDDKDFFQKFGLFIIILLSIINACILIYAISKLGKVSESFNMVASSLDLIANRLASNSTVTSSNGLLGVIPIG